MEHKSHYLSVGIFVLLFGAGMVLFGLWLAGFGEKKEYQYYFTYMNESVNGLNVGAPVKYMGMEIGHVSEIMVDPNQLGVVRLTLQISSDVRARRGMIATLQFTGITGIAYVEISGGKNDAPFLVQEPGETPVIPSELSLFAKLGLTADTLTLKATQALENIARLFNNKNIRNIEAMLADLSEETHSLKSYINETNGEHFSQLLASLKNSSAQLETFIPEAKRFFQNGSSAAERVRMAFDVIEESAERFKELSLALTKKVEEGNMDLDKMSRGLFEQIGALSVDLQTLVIEMRQLVEQLQSSPSDLIYKSSDPLLGPGETNFGVEK